MLNNSREASISAKAFGKINLTLEVTARRKDGYHEINSIIQTISLCDDLTVSHSPDLILEQSGYDLEPESDLALRAAKVLRNHAAISDGARIRIHKNLPLSSGLGGGSSNAASVLTLLSNLWGLSLKNSEISNLAASLGSDVPFFLEGGTSYVQGRGEIVRAMSRIPQKWFVLCVPEIAIPYKTATMYSLLEASDFTSGGLSRKIEARVNGGGDFPEEFLFNVFDRVAIRNYKSVASVFDAMYAIGVKNPHLAGSGPTVYGIVNTYESARAMQLLLELKHGFKAYIAEPVFDGPVPL